MNISKITAVKTFYNIGPGWKFFPMSKTLWLIRPECPWQRKSFYSICNRLHNTQHKDIQHNWLICGTQHNDTQHNDTQHNSIECLMLSLVVMSVAIFLFLCWVSLCLMSLCWMSLCWMSQCWMAWRLVIQVSWVYLKINFANEYLNFYMKEKKMF